MPDKLEGLRSKIGDLGEIWRACMIWLSWYGPVQNILNLHDSPKD